MSEDRREFEKTKAREREKAASKHHEREADIAERKGYGAPRPFWLIILGIPLVLFIIYLWTTYSTTVPRAG
jgi:hypothetical protein